VPLTSKSSSVTARVAFVEVDLGSHSGGDILAPARRRGGLNVDAIPRVTSSM